MSSADDFVFRLLAEQLQADDSMQAYILIDPYLREPLDPHLLKANNCETTIVPIHYPSVDKSQWPRSIHWHPHAVDVLRASYEHYFVEQDNPDIEAIEGFSVGGWLLSASSAFEIAEHLASVMTLSSPLVSSRRYCRWADRRVLEWIWPDLDPEQRSQLLGPIRSWITFDRTGQIVSRQSNSVSRQADKDIITAATKFQLHPRQWKRMEMCGLIQQVLRGWQGFSETLPENYLAQAMAAVEAIHRLNVAEPQDVVLLAAYTLQIHSRLLEHPRVINLVQSALHDGIPLSTALEEIPDPSGWDDIRHELQQKTSF